MGIRLMILALMVGQNRCLWEYLHRIRRSWSMHSKNKDLATLLECVVAMALFSNAVIAQTAGPVAWQNDLTPIGRADWNYDFAAHLLERAGFGGTPEEIEALAKMTPEQ